MNDINFQPIILAILATVISIVMVNSAYAQQGEYSPRFDHPAQHLQAYEQSQSTPCPWQRVRTNISQELQCAFAQCRFRNIGFQGPCMTLRAPDRQSLFVIHNCSGKVVYLRHSNVACAEGAGWDAKIDPNNVSAFALDINNESMQFQCFVQRHWGWGSGNLKQYDQISCRDVLNVCQQPGASFVVGNEGSYWVADNYARVPAFVRHIHQRGIYWPS